MNKTYTVATNDFMAVGGDDYPCFGDVPTLNEYSSLEEYSFNVGTVSYTKQGRILAGTMVNGVIKVEVESEYVKDILTSAINSGYTVEVLEEGGKSIVKIYAPKAKNNALVAILEVKDLTVEELNNLVEEIKEELENSKPDNGGSDDEDQDGNNGNSNKPSNPQTGDATILGYVGMSVAAIAGVFVNNRRRKEK